MKKELKNKIKETESLMIKTGLALSEGTVIKFTKQVKGKSEKKQLNKALIDLSNQLLFLEHDLIQLKKQLNKTK